LARPESGVDEVHAVLGATRDIMATPCEVVLEVRLQEPKLAADQGRALFLPIVGAGCGGEEYMLFFILKSLGQGSKYFLE
jgi:hypothetical protein